MMTFEYKGYVAEVNYEEEAQLYCGSVVNTEAYPIVIFELPEGEGYDIYREFQTSVDVYLESCAEDGVEPLPPLPHPSQSESPGEAENRQDQEAARL